MALPVNAGETDRSTMFWQAIIHLTFVASGVSLALIDRYLSPKAEAPAATR